MNCKNNKVIFDTKTNVSLIPPPPIPMLVDKKKSKSTITPLKIVQSNFRNDMQI